MPLDPQDLGIINKSLTKIVLALQVKAGARQYTLDDDPDFQIAANTAPAVVNKMNGIIQDNLTIIKAAAGRLPSVYP